MADTILKPKVQIRSTSVTSNGGGSSSSSSTNGDKTPTTPSKLLINHGKPNFTIQRSPKVQQNGDGNPLSPQFESNKNNNYNAFKLAGNTSNNFVISSTKFNGAFRPTNVAIAPKQPHQQSNTDNEATKVVLRRAKVAEPVLQDDEDDSVPEFIRRQRRIQERLAKENILDFENRRSGYFTHVMITPTSPNRQSFVETMASPAIVPALEIPPPTTPPATVVEETYEEVQHHVAAPLMNGTTNSHSAAETTAAEEEEVAKAIEEVNKAVAGEDDEKPIESTETEISAQPTRAVDEEEIVTIPTVVPVATTWEHIEVTEGTQATESQEVSEERHESSETVVTAVTTVTTLEYIEEPMQHEEPVASKQNGHVEIAEVHAPKENGHSDVTISHTNGFDGPCIPSPDPSGVLGVNYEPKTVVSFSKDLGSEVNKYPDTVKIINENGEAVPTTTKSAVVDEELQDLAKLKFDIKTDEQDVQVTPVLRAE